MKENLIEIKNLSFYYHDSDVAAVKNINLNIASGEFIAVLGHNGSGKSTLAKLLNGLLLPSEGDVLVAEKNTQDYSQIFEIRRKVAMVFQNPDNQMVASTVEDDIAFGLENIGFEPSLMPARIDEVLGLVDMLDFKDKPPHRLSGGQKQRVAIAGVLAMQPQCIVFDESTAMLDPEGRKEVIDTLVNLHKSGMAIILITHFAEEAVLADKVLIMHEGEIVKAGVPEEVFQIDSDLEQYSLALPTAIKIAKELKKEGMNLGVVGNRKELVEAICQYKLKQ